MQIDAQNEVVDRDLAMRIVGLKDRAFTNLGLAVIESRGRSQFYALDDVLEMRDSRLEKRVVERERREAPVIDDSGNPIDIETERKMKLRAERIGQEIKNAEALGELAPLDLMSSALSDCLAKSCSFLESVPGIVKRVHPDVTGAALDAIEREMAKTRNSIADGRIDYTDPRMAEFSASS